MQRNEDFDCHFRPAVTADFARLHDLASRCWIEIYERHVRAESVRRFWDEDGAGEYVREFLPSIQVAAVGGEVIGMISVASGCIAGLYVNRRYRGNLIGTSLLHNAALDGGKWIEVSANNLRAIVLYERRGWRRVSLFREDVFGTSLPAIVMTRGFPGTSA
jgi:ribosomal protein S18 acetylase RimI-like enzyme